MNKYFVVFFSYRPKTEILHLAPHCYLARHRPKATSRGDCCRRRWCGAQANPSLFFDSVMAT
jgi:hypothetical protein